MDKVLHPIQLKEIYVAELYIKVHKLEIVNSSSGGDVPFNFSTGHSQFNQDTSMITVGVIGEAGGDAPDNPFHAKVHILGNFHVDTQKFPEDKISQWASENAPILLLPFLREHLYGLASRSGIKNLLVPLFVLPTVKVNAPQN